MHPAAEVLRCERKLVLPEARQHAVEALVRGHPALFRETFPPRTVHNVYLDTPDRRCYRTHVDGAAERSKVRIRWYQPAGAGAATPPALEVKTRRGQTSRKRTWPLEGLDGVCLVQGGPALAAAVSARVTAPIAAALSGLRPSLHNRYRRRYFLSGDGRFRLTVDDAVRFAGPAGGVEVRWAGAVLELKYAAAAEGVADRVTAPWPLRVVRFSKYCAGVELLVARGLA